MIRIYRSVWATTEEPQSVAYAPNDIFTLNPRMKLVALPARIAGHDRPGSRRAQVVCILNGRYAVAEVWDIGPWNIANPYWDLEQRPAAERQYASYRMGVSDGSDKADSRDASGNRRSVVNPAGVDLSGAVWVELGVPEERAYSNRHSAMLDWLCIVTFD